MATTLDSLRKLSPNGKASVINAIAPFIDKYAGQYEVNTDLRKKHFLSQAAHETDGFNTLREYASGAAYEGRIDLGNTQPGEGKKFRGRGIFQTTGRNNYERASMKIFGDKRLLTNPELLEQPEYAVKSAFIFWNDKKLNTLADQGDTPAIIKAITKKINGGYNGLQERMDYFARIKNFIFSNPATAVMLLIAGIGLIAISYFLVRNSSVA